MRTRIETLSLMVSAFAGMTFFINLMAMLVSFFCRRRLGAVAAIFI